MASKGCQDADRLALTGDPAALQVDQTIPERSLVAAMGNIDHRNAGFIAQGSEIGNKRSSGRRVER